jgi:hypothetical protein
MPRPIKLTYNALELLLADLNKQEVLSLCKKLGLKTSNKSFAITHILQSWDRIKVHVSFSVPAKQSTTETLDQLIHRHE